MGILFVLFLIVPHVVPLASPLSVPAVAAYDAATPGECGRCERFIKLATEFEQVSEVDAE